MDLIMVTDIQHMLIFIYYVYKGGKTTVLVCNDNHTLKLVKLTPTPAAKFIQNLSKYEIKCC